MIAEGGGQQSEDLHRDYFDASGDIMVETKRLKAIFGISAVIEQDPIQQHPVNPVIPSKNSSRTVTIKIYEEPICGQEKGVNNA